MPLDFDRGGIQLFPLREVSVPRHRSPWLDIFEGGDSDLECTSAMSSQFFFHARSRMINACNPRVKAISQKKTARWRKSTVIASQDQRKPFFFAPLSLFPWMQQSVFRKTALSAPEVIHDYRFIRVHPFHGVRWKGARSVIQITTCDLDHISFSFPLV